MLVLSRQFNETLKIGDDISVTVVQIQFDKVRLGIVAPVEVPVHRLEVFEAIQREGRKFTRPANELQRNDAISAALIRSFAGETDDGISLRDRAIGSLFPLLRAAGYLQTIEALRELGKQTMPPAYTPTNGPSGSRFDIDQPTAKANTNGDR